MSAGSRRSASSSTRSVPPVVSDQHSVSTLPSKKNGASSSERSTRVRPSAVRDCSCATTASWDSTTPLGTPVLPEVKIT